MLFRTITIKNGKTSRKYKAEFGDLENARVTITKDKKVHVSEDLEPRVDDALFEAIFDNRSRINVITGNYDENGLPLFTIGKLEQSSPKVELKTVKSKKLKEIASLRYDEEVKGIEVDGIHFNTDRSSVSRLYSEYSIAVNDESYSTTWKTNKGFINLSREQFINIVKKVRQYIQSCFDKEKSLTDKINSSKTLEELKKINW